VDEFTAIVCRDEIVDLPIPKTRITKFDLS